MSNVVEVVEGTRYENGSLTLPVSDAELLGWIEERKVVVLKSVFDRDSMTAIRDGCVRFARENEQLNPELTVGIPNFYRVDNDPPKSAVKRICRSFALFYWNDDDFGGERPYLQALAGLRNRLAGLPEGFAFEGVEDGQLSIPSIVHYPVGGGYLQTHEDPPSTQRAVVTAILSELGSDYESGGLYVDDPKTGERVLLDSQLEVGDVYMINPAITHGVAPVDADEPLAFDSGSGRWMMFSALVPFASLSGEATEGLKAYPEETEAHTA